MATDWWPTQEGRLAEGLTISAIAGATITENTFMKFGTSASGQITVSPATAVGDGWGVALKGVASGEPVPVMVLGLTKVSVGEAITQGNILVNSGPTYAMFGGIASNTTYAVMFGGNSHMLGTAMQTSTASADEIAILVGRCT
jgi:hypothetical protein